VHVQEIGSRPALMADTVRPVPADLDIRAKRAADSAAVRELRTVAFRDDALCDLAMRKRSVPPRPYCSSYRSSHCRSSAALPSLSFAGCAGGVAAQHVVAHGFQYRRMLFSL
jgi:hypothetical protein